MRGKWCLSRLRQAGVVELPATREFKSESLEKAPTVKYKPDVKEGNKYF